MQSKWLGIVGLALVLLAFIMFFMYRPSVDTTPVITEQDQVATSALSTTDMVMETWFTPLIPLQLGDTVLSASVADTPNERAQGLSGTPYLPQEVVKLFVFDYSFPWGFWMQDMNYPIDIIWLDEEKIVVHVVERVTPDSYPTSFTPPVSAKYVIETVAGFTAVHAVATGTVVTWGE